jgi:quinoprotein glucose dehydrogenase
MSITGGFVYHGTALPDLKGCFIYGDWRFGNMWALHYDPDTEKTSNYVIHTPPEISNPIAQPTGFYPDENGEPLVLDWKGKIFRMIPK